MNPSPGGNKVVGPAQSTTRVWRITSGEAKITEEGDLKVEVEGLLRDDDTTAEVSEVYATLVCVAGGSVTSARTRLDAFTGKFPITPWGDAKIEVPDFLSAANNSANTDITECHGPVILVEVGTHRGADFGGRVWMAISGITWQPEPED